MIFVIAVIIITSTSTTQHLRFPLTQLVAPFLATPWPAWSRQINWSGGGRRRICWTLWWWNMPLWPTGPKRLRMVFLSRTIPLWNGWWLGVALWLRKLPDVQGWYRGAYLGTLWWNGTWVRSCTCQLMKVKSWKVGKMSIKFNRLNSDSVDPTVHLNGGRFQHPQERGTSYQEPPGPTSTGARVDCPWKTSSVLRRELQRLPLSSFLPSLQLSCVAAASDISASKLHLNVVLEWPAWPNSPVGTPIFRAGNHHDEPGPLRCHSIRLQWAMKHCSIGSTACDAGSRGWVEDEVDYPRCEHEYFTIGWWIDMNRPYLI